LRAGSRRRAAFAIDDAREDRWAQEVVPAIVVGDVVWLATPTRAKVPAIPAAPAGRPSGVTHPRRRSIRPPMIGGLRALLADAGCCDVVGPDAGAVAGETRDAY
jgi:hypothetical protein